MTGALPSHACRGMRLAMFAALGWIGWAAAAMPLRAEPKDRNVAEWVLDQYKEDYLNTIPDGATNPLIDPGTTYPRSVRGGGYLDEAVLLRCAARSKSEPAWNKRDPQIPKSKWWLTDGMAVGFRLVRPAKAPTAEEADAFYKKYLGN